MIYEFTDYGSELEDVVLSRGRRRARTLEQPGPEDIVTVDSMITDILVAGQ